MNRLTYLRTLVRDVSLCSADADVAGGWTVVAYSLQGTSGHLRVCHVTRATPEEAVEAAITEVHRYRQALLDKAAADAAKDAA